MANSHEIIKYKQTAVSLIVNDPNIIRFIDNKEVEYADDLIYKNIFPFMKIPGTEQERLTYVLMYVDMPDNKNPNNLMKDMQITFVVATHQDLMQVKGGGGTRTDLLSEAVDKCFNGIDAFGIGRLKLLSNTEGSLDKMHPCRTLEFTIMDFDNKENNIR